MERLQFREKKLYDIANPCSRPPSYMTPQSMRTFPSLKDFS